MDGDRHKDVHSRLSDSEREALAAMSRSTEAPRDLEDRTVMALREQGLVRSRGGILMKLSIGVGTAAAVALIFVAGMSVGKRGESAAESGNGTQTATTETASKDKQYMLLLFVQNSPQRAERTVNTESEAYLAIIEEYRSWGQKLAESGKLVSAEKLKDDTYILSDKGTMVAANHDSEGRVLGGYFLIKAASLDEAREIAMTHPHLKYGGEVEIRPLDLHD